MNLKKIMIKFYFIHFIVGDLNMHLKKNPKNNINNNLAEFLLNKCLVNRVDKETRNEYINLNGMIIN
jgi:hypothetical protein